MVDPAGESVTPDKFLTAAERYQLATDIDRWVVQYALEILSSAAPALDNLGAHFCINISGQSLGDEQFPQFLENKLLEYALPRSLLSFEITETAAVANIVRAEVSLTVRVVGCHAVTLGFTHVKRDPSFDGFLDTPQSVSSVTLSYTHLSDKHFGVVR